MLHPDRPQSRSVVERLTAMENLSVISVARELEHVKIKVEVEGSIAV